MIKTAIKLNQIYKSKRSDLTLIVTGRKGGKYRCKVLTEKPGVFNGSHSMCEQTLRRQYILIPHGDSKAEKSI